jgi:hypothetical protein
MNMEIFPLVLLILLNGFFAMSEIALVSARRTRLQPMVERGDTSARIAVELGAEPTRFLSTVQIGITSVAMLSGIVGEATLAPPLASRFEAWGAKPETAALLALVAVVVTVTYFSIVVGELVPKRIGQINAERVARFVARPIQVLAIVTRPFVWLLTGSTKFILRVLGVHDTHRTPVTEEEIEAVLQEGSTAGVIEEAERRMVENLFRLDDRSIATLMTPRADVAALDHDAEAAEVMRVMEPIPTPATPSSRAIGRMSSASCPRALCCLPCCVASRSTSMRTPGRRSSCRRPSAGATCWSGSARARRTWRSWWTSMARCWGWSRCTTCWKASPDSSAATRTTSGRFSVKTGRGCSMARSR